MDHTALLIMDFINDIAHPGGAISATAPYIETHQTISKVNHLIQWGRIQIIPIVYVKVGFSSNYLECPKNSPVFGKAQELQALKLDSWGTQFIDTLDRQPEDLIITKHRVSTFYGTALESFLYANHIDHLILAGVSTDMVVQHTARDAHDRDYRVTIVKDCCAARSQEVHEAALHLCSRIATITSTKALIGLCS